MAKDFATEPNEDKLRRAGHLMAQKLAGSLALVTCKDPLKSNLATHIRQHLSEHGFGEVRLAVNGLFQSSHYFQQLISEQVVSLLVQDNLDIACAAIEKAAMERAVTDVDDGFTASYEARRRHREVSRVSNSWTTEAHTIPRFVRLRRSGILMFPVQTFLLPCQIRLS